MSNSNIQDVQQVVASKGNSLRQMTQEELMILLPNEIQMIAISYCGAVLGDVLRDTASECFEFLMTMYGEISFPEIKRAFALTASCMIEGDLTAYYGNFTVRILGEVLARYMVYRRRIESALLQVEKETAAAEAEKQKAAYYKTTAGQYQLNEFWENQLKKYAAMEEIDATKVTSKVYEYLDKCGKLRLTADQKWDYFERAKILYQAELRNEMHTAPAVKRVTLHQILAQLNQNLEEKVALNEDIHVRLAGLAKRLAVVDYVKIIR